MFPADTFIDPLPNGHTLIAVADKDQNPRLIEVTAEGKTVWELSNADIPGKPCLPCMGNNYRV